ncbi:hypothetical protein F4808DRAFT_443146 [Astrocystis sublimbata]|nr:hypothetical protein F4808DRAFT_443146 [Astrocystis sublimbata]
MPDTAQIQAATLEQFLAGWKQFTPQSWTEQWSEDFQQQMLPFNLRVPPQPRGQALARLTKLMETLKNYEVNFHQVVHDSTRGKAFIYATSTADTIFGDFKWTNEYSVIITFTDDGRQINKLEEMVDTDFFRVFWPKFEGYLRSQGAL